MPRVSTEHKRLYESKIRGLLSQNQQITLRELQMQLEQEGHRLGCKHLGRLVNGIYRESARRADAWTPSAALATLRDARRNRLFR